MKKLLYFFFGFYFYFNFGMQKISQEKQEAMSHLPGVPLDYSNYFNTAKLSPFNYYCDLNNQYDDESSIPQVMLYFKQHPYHTCKTFFILNSVKNIFYLPLYENDFSEPDEGNNETKSTYQAFRDTVRNTLANNSFNEWNHKVAVDSMISYQGKKIIHENEFILFNISNIKFIPIKYNPGSKNGDYIKLFHQNSYGRFCELEEDGTIIDRGHYSYTISEVPKIIIQFFKKNKYAIINIDDNNNTVQLNLTSPQIQFLLHNKQRYPKISILHNNEPYDVVEIIDLSCIKKDRDQQYVENSLGYCDLEYKKKENKKNLKIVAKKNNSYSHVPQLPDKPKEDPREENPRTLLNKPPLEEPDQNSLRKEPDTLETKLEEFTKIVVKKKLNESSEHTRPTNKKYFLVFSIASITIASFVILFRNNLLNFLLRYQIKDQLG